MSRYTDTDERNDNSGRQWETPLTDEQRAFIAEQQEARDATARFFAESMDRKSPNPPQSAGE